MAILPNCDTVDEPFCFLQDWLENSFTSKCIQPGVRAHQKAELVSRRGDFIGGKHSEGSIGLRGM